MSGHQRWSDLDFYKAFSRENLAVMVAWTAGYVLALEDLESDLKQAKNEGRTTIDDALEEVQVTITAAKRTQAAIEEWN